MRERHILTASVPVLTADGRRARLWQALLSPGHCRLHALVIRYGLLPPRNVVVPIEQIADITTAQVRLRLNHAELAQLPTFQSAWQLHATSGGARPALVALQYGSAGTSERRIEVSSSTARAMVEQQGNPASGLIALRAGQPVWSGTQAVGRLERLLFNPEGQVRQIIVRTSRMFGRRVIVPINQVARCDAQGLWLALDRAAFDRLPDYRTDRAIAIDVDHALRADQLVRRLDYRSIDMIVSAGVVRLQGYAATPASRERAERAARDVRGVLAVTNQIVTDGEIQIAVAQALANDERTRGRRFSIHVQRGVVCVSGAVASAIERTAIETVAGSVPQARGVINYVGDLEDAGDAEDQRALFPRIGQDVYTTETRLGQVERLIIHPRHRRVTALVVRGWLANTQRTIAESALDSSRQERRLVVPISAVQDVTAAAVLLHISDDAAARQADLDPTAYTPAAAGWQPPYPYTHAQLLLERNRTNAVPSNTLGVPDKPESVLIATQA